MSAMFFEGPTLAIETSCDETSAAVVCGVRVLSNVVSSQIDLHAKTGGVVPEVAARAHVEAINPVIQQSLAEAQVELKDIRAIGVTNRPGLLGALSVGVTAGKALAFALGVPLVGVHHLEGHVMSPLGSGVEIETPHVCLLVSGGHTEIVLVEEWGRYRILGQTIDDAAGEAFDKSARLLGFPYPGGRALSEAAINGGAHRYALPEGLKGKDTLDFSFSGLKTAVLRLVERESEALSVEDAAASCQEAIVAPLVTKTITAVEAAGIRTVTLAGGVAANSLLRMRLDSECARIGARLIPAPLGLCTDNAGMIGIAANHALASGARDSFDLDCFASCELPVGAAL